MGKILDTTKEGLGLIPDAETGFEGELKTWINMVLSDMRQLGLGPAEGFRVTTGDETWEEFLGDNYDKLGDAEGHMVMAVKLLWDPDALPHVLTARQNRLEESTWRLNVKREDIDHPVPPPPTVPVPSDGGI